MKTVSKKNAPFKEKNDKSFREFMHKEFEISKECTEKFILNNLDYLLNTGDTKDYEDYLNAIENYVRLYAGSKDERAKSIFKFLNQMRSILGTLKEYMNDYTKDAKNLYNLIDAAADKTYLDKRAKEDYIKYLQYKDQINWKDIERADRDLRNREELEKKAAKRFPDIAKKEIAA